MAKVDTYFNSLDVVVVLEELDSPLAPTPPSIEEVMLVVIIVVDEAAKAVKSVLEVEWNELRLVELSAGVAVDTPTPLPDVA